MRWSNNRSDCSNCQSNERKHIGLGLCTLCYRLAIKKRNAERWQLENPSTLKNYPFMNFPEINPHSFKRFKRNVIQHYQDRLEYIKHREAKLKGIVDGLDLEYAFDHIARLAGSKKRNLFHGLCGWFDMIFDDKQKRALLRIADKIEKDANRDVNISSLLLKYD